MEYNILITGANGQLGSEIKELDILYPDLQLTYTDVDTLDITRFEELDTFVSDKNFHFIVNCAAYTAVDQAESEPDLADKINCQAVKSLVSVAEKYQCRLIHISTDYIFDGKHYKPYTEEDIPNPVSVYGRSKLHGEEEALSYELTMIIRTSWLYSSFGQNFLKTMMKLGKEKDELKVVFDQVSTPTYAKDLGLAILEIIHHTSLYSRVYNPGIYHYSNEGVASWYDFALEIMELANIECKILPILTKEYPLPAKRPYYSVLNKKKIKSSYDLTIPHWKESLKKCIDKILSI